MSLFTMVLKILIFRIFQASNGIWTHDILLSRAFSFGVKPFSKGLYEGGALPLSYRGMELNWINVNREDVIGFSTYFLYFSSTKYFRLSVFFECRLSCWNQRLFSTLVSVLLFYLVPLSFRILYVFYQLRNLLLCLFL